MVLYHHRERKALNDKEVDPMKLSEYLAQNLPDSSLNHIYALRERLYGLNLIRSIEQEAMYSEQAKLEALAWYTEQMEAEAQKGSTGAYGKLFEVRSRIMWSVYHKTPFLLNDVKARPCGLADMTITLDGKRYSIEVKTGAGGLAYGSTPAEALAEFGKLTRSAKIVVWDYRKDGTPLAMKACDFFQMLEDYNGNIETWFAMSENVNGQWSVKLQPVHTSKKKLNYLDEMSGSGYDWETVLMTGTLE